MDGRACGFKMRSGMALYWSPHVVIIRLFFAVWPRHMQGNSERARECFTLLPLNPAGNPAIVSRYEPGIINRANVFQPLRTCESRLRLTLAATQIKSAPALSRSGSLSVYSIGFYSMI